jgi:hypothetical protein
MKDMIKGAFEEGMMTDSKAWQTSLFKMRDNLKSAMR